MANENNQKQQRGFASLSPERRKEIASMGGKQAQQNGTAHRWNKETASVAGKKSKRKASEE